MLAANLDSDGKVLSVEVVPDLETAAELFGPGNWTACPRGVGPGWYMSGDLVAPWALTPGFYELVPISEWTAADPEKLWSFLEQTGLDAATGAVWAVVGGAGRTITQADRDALAAALS